MKRLALLISVALAVGLRAETPAEAAYALQEGDIVFNSGTGEQADAIRGATGSPYTHCGVVFQENGKLMVLEAVQPVKVTPVEAFQKRSQPGSFHARRLKSPPAAAGIEKAKAWGKQQLGRDYDVRFQWGDDKLYCSELVWKVYEQAGVRLCEPRHFQDYQLDHPAVKPVIAQRYGSADKLPKDEPVVAPGDLAVSPLLVEVPREEKK